MRFLRSIWMTVFVFLFVNQVFLSAFAVAAPKNTARNAKSDHQQISNSQRPDEVYQNDFSYDFGANNFPQFLLAIGGVKDAPKLKGQIRSFQYMHRIGTSRWKIGVRLTDFSSHGSGPVLTDDLLKERLNQGIPDLNANGRLDIDIKGALVEMQRNLGSKRWPISPFIRFGGGVGRLKERFNGQSCGTAQGTYPDENGDLQAFSQSVCSPATDRTTKIIPLVDVQAGLTFRPKWMTKMHLAVDAGCQWNTGWGCKVSPHFIF